LYLLAGFLHSVGSRVHALVDVLDEITQQKFFNARLRSEKARLALSRIALLKISKADHTTFPMLGEEQTPSRKESRRQRYQRQP
jgi:hypothetical protein